MRRSLVNAAISIVTVLAFHACGGGGGGSPTTPTPITHARITATLTTEAQRNADGTRDYTVTVHLAETGGVGATINKVDFTFFDGSTALGASSFTGSEGFPNTSHLSANGSLSSLQLVSTDPDPSGPNATRVQAVIAYTDDAQQSSTVTQSSDLPALPPPPPAISYRLFGTVKNDADNKALGGAIVTVLDGPNAGRAVTSGGDGKYSLTTLTPGSFSVRFEAADHQSLDKSVALSKDTQLDVKLKRTSSSSSSSTSLEFDDLSNVPLSLPAPTSARSAWRTSVR